MDSDQVMLHAQYSGKELLANKPQDQNIPLTSAILSYEVGDFIRCSLNQHWGGVRGYHGETKIALADTITMCRLLAAILNIDVWDALRVGEERYMEAMSIKETRKDGVTGRPE
ncbi:hypothetical protein LCGC14_0448900 [marine sediment metagenome]|uniref:Uncharacterized protein n=1 Tax=marine sediment metagenome TaxID=412755 RepID=A0A0F9SNZ7_9ZZZZ